MILSGFSLGLGLMISAVGGFLAMRLDVKQTQQQKEPEITIVDDDINRVPPFMKIIQDEDTEKVIYFDFETKEERKP